MLQRDIDIFTDPFLAGDRVDELISHMGRKGVQQTDPADIFGHRHHFLQKPRERLLPVNIHPVGGDVLADDIDLLDPAVIQLFDLAHNGFHAAGNEFSLNGWNNAETAAVITTLTDLQVGEMPRRQGNLSWNILAVKLLYPEDRVDFLELFG